MQLLGFKIQHISTKSANSSAFPFTTDTKNDKPRPNLDATKERELESILIEIFQKNSSNVIIDFIYSYPWMHPKELNDVSLKSLTERLTKENNKEVMILGDFYIDLINSNSNANAREFLDVIYSTHYSPPSHHFAHPAKKKEPHVYR